MMKQIFRLLLILGLIVGWGFQGAVAGTVTNMTPQAGEWLKKAYLAVVEAELARAENHDAEAAKSYRTALGFYEQIKTEYPGWQASMMSARVTECQNALAALEMPREPEAGNDKKGDQGTTNTAARLQVLLEELRQVQTVLTVEKTSGEEVTSRQLEAEVVRLKEELNEAATSNHLLQRKMGKMEAKLNKAGISMGSPTNASCREVVSAVKSEANRLIQAGEMLSARTLLMEAIELMPSETDLVVLLAVAHCRDGRFDDAVKLMAPFDVWRAKNADALLTLGTAYMGLGEIGKARDAIEKTLAIKPDSAEAHYNMAQILITMAPPDVPGAQEHYQRALELGLPVDPDFENALRTAMIISRMKKHSETEKRSTRSVKSEVRTPGVTTDTP